MSSDISHRLYEGAAPHHLAVGRYVGLNRSVLLLRFAVAAPSPKEAKCKFAACAALRLATLRLGLLAFAEVGRGNHVATMVDFIEVTLRYDEGEYEQNVRGKYR